MLGLPQTTEVKKIIPKRALYSKFEMNTAEQKEFDAAIRQMTIVNEISLRTIPALQKQEQEKHRLYFHFCLKRKLLLFRERIQYVV